MCARSTPTETHGLGETGLSVSSMDLENTTDVALVITY